MQSPLSETSTSLIIDLVSKFLSKIFDQDPNCFQYTKQWSSFRELLTAIPLDLNPILSFISTLKSPSCQNNLSGISTQACTPLRLDQTIQSPTMNSLDQCPEVISYTVPNGQPLIVASPTKHRRAMSTRMAAVKYPAALNTQSPSKYGVYKAAAEQQENVLTRAGSIMGQNELCSATLSELSSPLIQPSILKPLRTMASREIPRLQIADSPSIRLNTESEALSGSASSRRPQLNLLAGLAKKLKGSIEKNSDYFVTQVMGTQEKQVLSNTPSPLRVRNLLNQSPRSRVLSEAASPIKTGPIDIDAMIQEMYQRKKAEKAAAN